MDNNNNDQVAHEAETAEKKTVETETETKQETAQTSESTLNSADKWDRSAEWCGSHPIATTAIFLGIPAVLGGLVGFVLGRASK